MPQILTAPPPTSHPDGSCANDQSVLLTPSSPRRRRPCAVIDRKHYHISGLKKILGYPSLPVLHLLFGHEFSISLHRLRVFNSMELMCPFLAAFADGTKMLLLLMMMMTTMMMHHHHTYCVPGLSFVRGLLVYAIDCAYKNLVQPR